MLTLEPVTNPLHRNDHTDANCESLPVSGFNSSDILVGELFHRLGPGKKVKMLQTLTPMTIGTPVSLETVCTINQT